MDISTGTEYVVKPRSISRLLLGTANGAADCLASNLNTTAVMDTPLVLGAPARLDLGPMPDGEVKIVLKEPVE